MVRHGQRVVLQLQLSRGSGRDERSAVLSCTRPEIDHKIGVFDHLAIMFHDNERIPQVAQLLQRSDQALVVTLMQPDTRFIQDIQHSDKLGTDLRGQADPLSFATRQGTRSAVEGQVFQSDIHKELEPLEDLFHDRCGDHRLAGMGFEPPEELQGFADRQINDLLDRGPLSGGSVLDADGKVLFLQPATLAFRAFPGVHVGFHPLPDVVRGGVSVVPLHRIQNSAKPVLVRHRPATAVDIFHREALIPASMEENLLSAFGDLFQRGVKIKTICLGNRPELVEHPGRPWFPHRREAALIDGKRIIGEDQVDVQLFDLAQTIADGASTVR